jgi:hypothetical protein
MLPGYSTLIKTSLSVTWPEWMKITAYFADFGTVRPGGDFMYLQKS